MKYKGNSKISPLAPRAFPDLSPVPGVEIGAIAAGLEYSGRLDLMLARFREGTSVAGLFTQNEIKSAAVKWCQEALKFNQGHAQAVVVNAGNANAYCGVRGVSAARRVATLAAEQIGCDPREIMLASTGVIGKALTATPFIKPIARLAAGLSNHLWRDAAHAIMTTDTFPKAASLTTEIAGEPIVLTGISKGSGMIAPNMATMLAFVFTNANITPDCLNILLRQCCAVSFNAITVDGDQSTNDTVLLFATGETNSPRISDPMDPRLNAFKNCLHTIMKDLAVQIVRDGEGAEHLIRIDVEGTDTDEQAQAIARSIANSPLVKTAIAGGDANWGRILMAAGNAGVPLIENALELYIGDQLVASGGSVMRAYSDEEASEYLKEQEIEIRLVIGQGEGQATAWTCDMTHGYIDINASYRS